MAKWCDEGENNILDIYFKGTSRPSFYIGLYTDSSEPGEDDTLSTITEVSVAYGYARIQVADGDWTLSTDHVTGAQKTFTASGGSWGTVTGWFLCTASSGTSGKLLAVQHFSSGHDMSDTSTLKLTPTITVS